MTSFRRLAGPPSLPGFLLAYPSVRRYVAKLKASEPERVWRIECQPGEELQVDFGLGAPLVEAGGKTRRTWLFRAVLSHSRKGYSEVVLRHPATRRLNWTIAVSIQK